MTPNLETIFGNSDGADPFVLPVGANLAIEIIVLLMNSSVTIVTSRLPLVSAKTSNRLLGKRHTELEY